MCVCACAENKTIFIPIFFSLSATSTHNLISDLDFSFVDYPAEDIQSLLRVWQISGQNPTRIMFWFHEIQIVHFVYFTSDLLIIYSRHSD